MGANSDGAPSNLPKFSLKIVPLPSHYIIDEHPRIDNDRRQKKIGNDLNWNIEQRVQADWPWSVQNISVCKSSQWTGIPISSGLYNQNCIMLKKGNFKIKLEFRLTDVYPQLPKPMVNKWKNVWTCISTHIINLSNLFKRMWKYAWKKRDFVVMESVEVPSIVAQGSW